MHRTHLTFIVPFHSPRSTGTELSSLSSNPSTHHKALGERVARHTLNAVAQKGRDVQKGKAGRPLVPAMKKWRCSTLCEMSSRLHLQTRAALFVH